MASTKSAKKGKIAFAVAGNAALAKGDRNLINIAAIQVDESADIDKHFEPTEPNANRWDYYLSARKGRKTIPLYLEVHELSPNELAKIVAKANWLVAKILANNWPTAEGVPLLLAGKFRVSVNGPETRVLARNGIEHVHRGTDIWELANGS